MDDKLIDNFGRPEELLLGVFEHFPAFICVIHMKDGTLVYCNHTARLLFGENKNLYKNVLRNDNGGDSTTKSIEYDECINDKWFHINDTEIIWVDAEPSRMIVGTDITTLKNIEQKLSLDAKLDLMTGIYNRQVGVDFLIKYIQDTKQQDSICTVCYIDINDLKFVNDNYGHVAGDEYIIAVVSSIKSSIRSTDIFARMGGDEFLLILPNCYHKVVENIMGIVSNKLELMSTNKPMPYSISYGIMEINPGYSIDSEYIMRVVDSRMYYMKEEYRKTRVLPTVNAADI